MRLREIEFALKNADDLLSHFGSTQAPNAAPPRFNISNLSSVRKGLAIINRTGLFSQECDALRLTAISNTNAETIQVINEEHFKIKKILGSLKENIRIILESISIALPPPADPNIVVYVKLPELNDIDGLSKFLDQLKKAIQIPITHSNIGGEVVINNFDTGSRWFEIVVKTSISAGLIGSLAWSGAVIYKKYQEVKVFEEHAKRIQLGTEHINALVEANKKQMDLLIEAEANYIQKEFYKNIDNEDLERLKLSIKSMSEMIEKGTQIQPALLAPENVSNLFPDYSNLMLIESKQKLIENK